MKKLTAKPTFDRFRIFNEDLTGVNLKKVKIILNRPTYAGFTILDLSKILMYSFHYDYMKLKYGDQVKLLFTDTDSLCYNVQTEDIYQDWKENKEYFDFSNYDVNHNLFNTDNKKVIGKMKDETAGIPIKEFVGLQSKMYSMTYGDIEKKTAKGISKVTIAKDLRHQQYKDCLFQDNLNYAQNRSIRSYDHQLFTIKLNKIGLSPYDDKRYVLENGIDTVAHGHYAYSE